MSENQPTNASKQTRDYEVGYGKPPVQSRFVKGRSGNPKGRKKTSRVEDIGSLFNAILDEEVSVRDGNRVRKMTRLEAMLYAQKNTALDGDPKALLTLFKIANKTGMIKPAPRKPNIEFYGPDGDIGRILRVFRRERDELHRQAQSLGQNEPANRT
jgi:hypothetical protein